MSCMRPLQIVIHPCEICILLLAVLHLLRKWHLNVIDQEMFDVKILGCGAWPGSVGVVGRKITFSVSMYFFVKGVK